MTITEAKPIAPSDEAQAVSLEDIVKHTVRALFRRYHLNRDWIIGLVGDRGSGKSLGGANVAIRDFAMNDEPLWSNMRIGLGVDVSESLAGQFGVERGLVVYQSEHIEKQAFLSLDERYEGGCLFFDEFNLEYGEARRSSANVNLMTDRAIQQLRKMQCGLIYTVLNEMYVDTRIRENTDLFIRCSDVAFKPENLRQKMRQGVQFEWLLYPMTAKLFGYGQTYPDTNKPVGPIQVTMGYLWDSIDTYERQAAGKMKYTDSKELLPVQMAEDPLVVKERDRWGWLDPKLTKFYDNHVADGDFIEIISEDFRHELGVEKKQWGYVVSLLYDLIPDLESRGKGSRANPTKFIMPNRLLTGVEGVVTPSAQV